MVSDRMIQAIGALERAITRLEQAADALPEASEAVAPAPASPAVDASSARAALKSLDDLITELKGRTSG